MQVSQLECDWKVPHIPRPRIIDSTFFTAYCDDINIIISVLELMHWVFIVLEFERKLYKICRKLTKDLGIQSAGLRVTYVQGLWENKLKESFIFFRVSQFIIGGFFPIGFYMRQLRLYRTKNCHLIPNSRISHHLKIRPCPFQTPAIISTYIEIGKFMDKNW